jgi:hypothetical protein
MLHALEVLPLFGSAAACFIDDESTMVAAISGQNSFLVSEIHDNIDRQREKRGLRRIGIPSVENSGWRVLLRCAVNRHGLHGCY